MSDAQQNLELLLLRLRAGHTYVAARRDLQLNPSGSAARKRFAAIEREILEQRVPALDALEALRRHWTLEEELRDLTDSKAYMPRLQFQILAGGAVLLALLSQVMFPAALRAGGTLLAIAATFLAVAWFWSRRLIRRFERDLWLGQWNLLLSDWSARLRCGQTFLSAVVHASPPGHLPASCRRGIANVRARLQQQPWPSEERRSARDEVQQWVGNQLRMLGDQGHAGQPVHDLIEGMIEANAKLFRRRTTKGADRLQMQLLLPLFTCLLPAFLLLLFGPLLRNLSQVSE